MTVKRWEKVIIEQMKRSGFYSEVYSSSIHALAEILEQRDRVKDEYLEAGGKAVVLHRLDRGAENMKINPLLKIWIDLNTQALAYWNSLGLTARSYKSMTGSLSVKVEAPSLDDIVADLEAEVYNKAE